MFPRSSPGGWLNVNGNLMFSKPQSRIAIYASGSRAEQRTIFTSPQGQNTVFGAMPGPGGALAVIQVYASNMDPVPAGGFCYGDLRIGVGLGQMRLSSAALNPDSSGGPPIPLSFPICLYAAGHSSIFGINGTVNLSDGAAYIDAAGNLGLGGVGTPAARCQLGYGGAIQFDRPDGTNQFRNAYIANDLNLVWTFNAGANIMKLQSDGTLIANYMVTSTLTLGSTVIAGGGNNAVMQRIAQVVCAGSQATVEFASIPPGFSSLMIVGQSKDTTSGTSDSNVFIKFNGDSTASNYEGPQALVATGTTAAGAAPAVSTAGFVIISHPNNGTSAARAGVSQIIIPNYAGSVFGKQALGIAYDAYGTSTATTSVYQRAGHWKPTTPINDVILTAATAFVNGSTFTLYGMP